MASLRTIWGVVRSVATYWRPGRQRGLRRMYAPFVKSGDLVFDVGAHVGDRSVAFLALGARVVALEPQPGPAAVLERVLRGRDGATLLRSAVGPVAGTARLAVSRTHPTVSTLAHDWRERVGAANDGFREVAWDDEVEVEVTTLDRLIETHGTPAFVKIDVEGFEAEVLAGLNTPVPALSVEFVAGTLDVTLACLERLEGLGAYRYRAHAGESRTPIGPGWWTADQARAWLEEGAGGHSSGDLYAQLVGAPDASHGTLHDTSHDTPREGMDR